MAFKRTGNILCALFLVLGLFTGRSVKPAHADGLPPTHGWNTFLGGADSDFGQSIAVDGDGDIYVAGFSYANWGNPIVPYAGSNGHSDGFIAKLDSSGNLLWNTFMGSSGNNELHGIILDSQGNVYVAGDAASTWGAPLHAFAGYHDAFIAKFNSSNGSRLWNTFLGGNDYDYGDAIAADGNGGLYVTGLSAATWGTPKTAFAGPVGAYDAFAAKLDNNGALLWNTFIGGSGQDSAYAITVDEAGQYAYVTGNSLATWGAPVNPFATGSSSNGFAAKLDASDGTREWNTFLGGLWGADGYGIVLDGNGNSYVSGVSGSTWGTPINPFSGMQDAYVAKLNSSGVLQWNTFLGGTDRDSGLDIALDGDNNLYLTGESSATWGNPINPHHAVGSPPSNGDAFIAGLNTDGNLLWNTFIGGYGDEGGVDIAIGGTRGIYIVGSDSETWGAPIRNFGGTYDAFVASYPQPNCLTDCFISGNTGVAGATLDYTGGSVSADNDGNYSITIPYNWLGTVTPSKTGYSFIPASRDYSNVTLNKASEDFSATLGAHTPWNTFLGGAGNDFGGSIAVDGEGNIYASGTSYANWGNPIVPYSGSNAHSDGFVAKLDSSGNLLWNTFIGSSDDSGIYSIALDDQGNVYVVGDSVSTWGAPLHGFAGTSDVFIAKFNSANGSRLWNTFLGGTDYDYGMAIAADNNGALYVTGLSTDTWGSPKTAFAGPAGTYDGFAAKLDSNGALQWNTFMGGTGRDYAYGINVDEAGQYAFVTGDSFSTWGTPVNPFAPGSSYDAYVTKLNSSDGTREWNTFLGGSGSSTGYGIALDGSGNSYISGNSSSTWGVPINAFSGGPSDAFVAKLNNSGVLQWNTFFGGNGRDTGWDIALVGDRNLYLTGNSQAEWGDPLNPYHSGEDAFIAQLNSAGNLLWNTFIGGAGDERSYGITIGATGDIYILGDTSATWGTPILNFGGAYDTYIASYQEPTFLISGNAGVAGATVNYTGGSTTADNGGNYTITIPYNWSGTVTPSKTGYTFTPASKDYANVTADKTGEDYVATQATYTLTINTIGNGTVTRSLPDPYNFGDIVNLTPVPDSGWIFSGWSGACTGTAACSVTMDADKTVSVTFQVISGPPYNWNTFLGGAGNDLAGTIAVDSKGNIYVGGISYANWGNPIIPYSGSDGHSDGFLAKLDSSGNLLWNTFIGSSSNNELRVITLDDQGNVYVAGDAVSTWGAPLHEFSGTNDAYIAKFNSTEGSRLWNTFLGGTDYDYGAAIAADGNGGLYITGFSAATWGSPKTAFANPAGAYDGFAAKLDSNGALQWNTFMGGSSQDTSYAIAVDKAGQYAVITGNSSASWGAPVNPFAPGSSNNGFAAKLNASDGTREWNTFFGGLSGTTGFGIVLDGNENPYISGISGSTWGAPTNAFSGRSDAFAAKLNSSGVLQWNTFLGGAESDGGGGIALDGDSNLYISGFSQAVWGNPLNPYHPTSGEPLPNGDAFIAKLNTNGNLIWNTFIGSASDDAGGGIVVEENGAIYLTGASNATWGTPVHNFVGAYDAFVASYLQPTFIISGNAGVAGATVNYTAGSTTADNDGHYSITVPYNWSGTVTPSKTGYTFSPASKSYANITQDKPGEDYVATPNNIRIVTNTSPWGAGSLSDAIFYSVSGDTIIFDPTLAGETIYFVSQNVITKSITIDASNLSTPVILDGQGVSRLFQISSGITFELKNIVLKNGYYNGDGGAIDNHGILKLIRTVISNSTAFGWGGGIYNAGQLTVVDSTFLNNNSNQADGGAIYTSGTASTATIQNSTFHDNNPYAVYSRSTLNVTNSTFTGNGFAGIYTSGKLTIKNSTISNNGGFGIEAYASYSGGTNTSTLKIENTILANNGSSDCYNNQATVLSFINNLVKIGNCGTPVSSADPKLGALADNGGPTWTMALLPGSPALDAGDDATCQTVDQRGITRPQGPHCDIGAFENVPIIPPQYTLTINKIGNGVVTPDKAAPYHLNDVVGLTPVPDAGWSFSGWTGDCTGSGACSVTMDADKSVNAIFIQNGQNVIYDDADAAWTYTGAWVPWATTGPDHDTVHYSFSVGDSAQLAFTGRQIKLTYATGSGGGLVDVYVDNVKIATIDESSATWEWQKSWTSDLLPAGAHDLRLVFASGGFATLDSLEAIAAPAILTNGAYDDSNAAWWHTGAWTTWAIPSAYQNTLNYSFTVGDSFQTLFTGRQIKLGYLASPMSGILDVYVDGAKIASLNQSSPYWEWQKTWTSDLLPAGTHGLRLVFASGGSNSFANIDSMEVIASPVILTEGVYDDANPALSPNGSWQSMTGVTGPYLGSLQYSFSAGDAVQVGFTGRQFKLSYLAGPTAGILDVYVDGAKIASIDQSSALWVWQKMWTSDLLPTGTHSLRLVYASGGFTSFDSIGVVATPPILTNGSYDDGDAAWTYAGSWSPWTITGPTQDSLHYSYSVGDSAQVIFSGQQIRLGYLASPISGMVDVYVDGAKVGSIDQSSATWIWQRTWTSGLLPAGNHSLRLVFASGGSNTFTNIDSLEVIAAPVILTGGTYDDANAAFTYDGSWLTQTGVTGPYQDTQHYTYGVGDSAQVAFTGTQIKLIYLASSMSGIVDVYVDGVKVGAIDQHSAGWDWQQSWTSDQLSAGTHMLRLVYASGGSDTLASVDAITVIP